jgi:hypothetical protein
LRGLEHPPTHQQIDYHCSLSTYSWQAYLEHLKDWANTVPCLLCGQFHPLKVHSYVERKVRLPQSCTNTAILIIVIVCNAAKAHSRQYTKRMLPPFLVPFCVIGRDGVLSYLNRHPDATLHYRHALESLGALDRRTIRRHLEEARQLIGEALREAAALLAECVFWATLPPRPIAQTDLEYLKAMSAELSRAACRACGGAARSIPAMVLVHLRGVALRHRGTLAVSMTSVLRALVFHDTG